MTAAFEAFPQLDTGTHSGVIYHLRATRDGRLLASGGETTVRVWDLAGRRLQRLLLGRVDGSTEDDAVSGIVCGLVISPDGRWLATIKSWVLRPGERARRGRAGSDDGYTTELQIFDLQTGNLQSSHLYPGMMLELDFSPDGRWLALAVNVRKGRQHQAQAQVHRVRDLLKPGARALPAPVTCHTLEGQHDGVKAPVTLAFVPAVPGSDRSGATLVVASVRPDGMASRLDWLALSKAGRLAPRRSVEVADMVDVGSMAASPSRVVIGAVPSGTRKRRGTLYWWPHDGSESGTLDLEAPPASVAFSPSGRHLAVGLCVDPMGAQDALEGTQTVQVSTFEVAAHGAPTLCSTYYGHDGSVWGLCFVGDRQVASAGGDNRSIHLWGPQRRVAELDAALRGVGRRVVMPGITADERVVFGTVPLRQLPPGHAPRQQSFDLRHLALSTTTASRLRRDDWVSRKWYVGEPDEMLIPLWFVGDRPQRDANGPPPHAPDLKLFVGADDEWMIWSPSGYYLASGPAASQRIGYRVNRGPAQEAVFIPSDRFKPLCSKAIIEAIVLHGSEARARAHGVRIPPVNVAQMLPPIVELATDGVARSDDRVQIAFTVDSPSARLLPRRLTLLRNGRVVWTDAQPPQRPHLRCKVPPLPLLPGPNRFALLAENERSSSVPVEFEIEGPQVAAGDASAPEAPGRLFLLSVGVGRFADPDTLTLRFPKRDAQAVFDAIAFGRLPARPGQPRRGGKAAASGPSGNRAFESVDAQLLVDEQATKAAILGELDRMCASIRQRHQAAGAERDVLFVFLSSHGVRLRKSADDPSPQLFFQNHDLVPTLQDLEATGLSILDLGDRITSVPAEVVLVVDACFSGLAGSGLMGGLDAEELARRVQSIYQRGMYVVSASLAGEHAREDDSQRHGVLTAAVLHALHAAGASGRGRAVLMADLLTSVQRLVPRSPAPDGKLPQLPVCRIYGDLTPLTILKT